MRNNNLLTLRNIFLSMVIVTFSNASSGYRDPTLDRHTYEIRELIAQVLIRNAYCDTHDKCTEKQLFFTTAGKSFIKIETYSLQDNKVLLEIMDVCTKKYLELHGEVEIRLRVYSYSKEEWLRRSSWNRNYEYEIHLNKGEKNVER